MWRKLYQPPDERDLTDTPGTPMEKYIHWRRRTRYQWGKILIIILLCSVGLIALVFLLGRV